MSRTFKIQRAYRAHKKQFNDLTINRMRDINDTFRDTGVRYGNQRKMRAKLKVSERRLQRRRENRLGDITEQIISK